jgi:hypothetical protein
MTGMSLEFEEEAGPTEEPGPEADRESRQASDSISDGESDKIINGELAEEGSFTSVVCN